MKKSHAAAAGRGATVGGMRIFARELRFAWRSLRRRPAYFATSAATLTLVLAASTAIFSAVNATLLRPMPFAADGEVVHVFS
jgi:putative ABC transport system permease protein